MFCYACGQQNSDDANFCVKCGKQIPSSLPSEKTGTYLGNENKSTPSIANKWNIFEYIGTINHKYMLIFLSLYSILFMYPLYYRSFISWGMNPIHLYLGIAICCILFLFIFFVPALLIKKYSPMRFWPLLCITYFIFFLFHLLSPFTKTNLSEISNSLLIAIIITFAYFCFSKSIKIQNIILYPFIASLFVMIGLYLNVYLSGIISYYLFYLLNWVT